MRRTRGAGDANALSIIRAPSDLGLRPRVRGLPDALRARMDVTIYKSALNDQERSAARVVVGSFMVPSRR
jgi:hypothetical protein